MDEFISPKLTLTTVQLLRCWFNPRPRPKGAEPDVDDSQSPTGPDFDERQRRVLLETITAHEAAASSAPRPARPVHHVALTGGTGQIQVVLALLIWQLLNYRAAKMARVHDARFTSHFLLVAHHACVRSRLFEALCGKTLAGGYGTRDFFTSDVVRLAPLLIPDTRRDEVLGFLRSHAGSASRCLRQTQADGIVAITDGRVEALECLARLSPDAMVFDDETRPPHCARSENRVTGLAWRQHVRRVAALRNGCGVQVVFTEHAPGEPTKGNTATP